MSKKKPIISLAAKMMAGLSLVVALFASASIDLRGLPRVWFIEIFYPHLVSEDGSISMSGVMLQEIKSNITLMATLALVSCFVFYVIAQKQSNKVNAQID